MKRSRWTAIVAVIVVSVGTLGVTAVTAGAQSSGGGAPKATDVGITDKEIHVAVIADVDNPIVPNLFKASKDAVEGAAKFLNSKAGGGGLAGRKVVVDFYDSKLNANATTNAEIQACQNDVAMVGTSAVSLASVDNMRNCKDSTGAVTGLPDIPFVTTALVQQCSDQSFPIAPPQVICSTATQHPQTFQPNVGRGYYYKKKFGDLHGFYFFGSDSKSARDSSFVSGIGQLRQVCIKSDQDFDISSFAPQSAYTPVIQAMKNDGSNYGQANQGQSTILTRKEATLQGLTGVKVWDCTTGCYSKSFLSDGGSDVESEYVDTLYLPFLSKADQNSEPDAQELRDVHRCGQGGRVRRLRLVGDDRLSRRGEQRGQGQRRRERRHPQDDLRGVEQDPPVRRRRHVRHHRPRRPQDLAVSRALAGEERCVPAHLPVEGGYVRLRQEECGPGQAQRVLI